MQIVLLGWGSLVWRPETLKLSGRWILDGPILPIEFSRISKNQRLTLVIDEGHGVPTKTRYGLSAFSDLTAAIENLQKREQMPNAKGIGYLDRQNQKRSSLAWQRHPAACERIRKWIEEKRFDAVIWTALAPNFVEKAQGRFSPQAALGYLASLKGQARHDAFEYVRNAPSEVVTPVRELFEARFSNEDISP